MSGGAKLRALLARDRMVVAPGVYDGITAKLVERAGFEAAYMTGAGTALALGFPDYGLVSLDEMSANVERLAAAIDIPIIADADTGFGNELNVVRTVQDYQRRGAAAVQLEDQEFPKRCGHLDDKVLVSADAFARKIAAAAYARGSGDILIVARTDARAAHGIEEAVRRGNAALDAGADIVFIEAPQTLEEIAAAPGLVHGPCLLNMVRGGKSPLVSVEQAQAFGYKLSIVPGLNLVAAIGACEAAMEAFLLEGVIPQPPRDMTVLEMFERLGVRAWDAHRKAVS